MRVIISSEQRRIWVDCQNTSTRNLRADTKQQQASRELRICPGPWERKMKEAMGQTGDLRKVDLRTTTARQLLNHEGNRNTEKAITGGIMFSKTNRTQMHANWRGMCSTAVYATLLE